PGSRADQCAESIAPVTSRSRMPEVIVVASRGASPFHSAYVAPVPSSATTAPAVTATREKNAPDRLSRRPRRARWRGERTDAVRETRGKVHLPGAARARPMGYHPSARRGARVNEVCWGAETGDPAPQTRSRG